MPFLSWFLFSLLFSFTSVYYFTWWFEAFMISYQLTYSLSIEYAAITAIRKVCLSNGSNFIIYSLHKLHARLNWQKSIIVIWNYSFDQNISKSFHFMFVDYSHIFQIHFKVVRFISIAVQTFWAWNRRKQHLPIRDGYIKYSSSFCFSSCSIRIWSTAVLFIEIISVFLSWGSGRCICICCIYCCLISICICNQSEISSVLYTEKQCAGVQQKAQTASEGEEKGHVHGVAQVQMAHSCQDQSIQNRTLGRERVKEKIREVM